MGILNKDEEYDIGEELYSLDDFLKVTIVELKKITKEIGDYKYKFIDLISDFYYTGYEIYQSYDFDDFDDEDIEEMKSLYRSLNDFLFIYSKIISYMKMIDSKKLLPSDFIHSFQKWISIKSEISDILENLDCIEYAKLMRDINTRYKI